MCVDKCSFSGIIYCKLTNNSEGVNVNVIVKFLKGLGIGMRVAKKCMPAKGYKRDLKVKGLFVSDGEDSEGDTSDRSSGVSVCDKLKK